MTFAGAKPNIGPGKDILEDKRRRKRWAGVKKWAVGIELGSRRRQILRITICSCLNRTGLGFLFFSWCIKALELEQITRSQILSTRMQRIYLNFHAYISEASAVSRRASMSCCGPWDTM